MSCAPCAVGVFPKRVTIQKPDPDATAGLGGHVDLADSANWTTVATRPARLKPRTGIETRVLDQQQGVASFSIETPSDPVTRSLQSNWRMVIGTRVFNIESSFGVPGDDGVDRYVRCHVKEGT